MSIDSAPAISQILCISVDNSPLVGNFISEPTSVSSFTLDLPSVARSYTYMPPTRVPYWQPATLSEKQGVYVANARVQAAVVESSVMRPVSGGWWSIPYPDASGACSNGPGYTVKMREALAPRQCTRAPAILSASTCAAWGSDRLLSYLKIATSPGKQPDPNPLPTFAAGGDWISVDTGSIFKGSVATGILTSGTLSDLNVGSAFSQTSCLCNGVLTGISYTVSYDGTTNIISSVTADGAFWRARQCVCVCVCSS